jgi:WD40 repeat protein
LLTGSSNGLVSIWNAENGEASRDLTGHTSSVTWASFSLDGKSVVSGGLDALVRVSEVKAGAAPRELKGHRGRISAVYFTSDGGLISSGADGSVRLWPKP